MSLFLLSAPAEPTRTETVAKLREKISSKASDLADVFPFNLPDFKVGTLDTLVVLSDDLAKSDAAFEAITVKIGENLRGLLSNDLDQWRNNLTVNEKSIDQYIKTFQWNAMKYRTDKSLRELTDTITQEVNSIDSLMKTKMQTYTTVKSQLTGMQRKQTGNLAVRSVYDVVKKEYFVLDSEYLITALVAVPRSSEKEWYAAYETLTQMVVPRSSQPIAEDDEYILFTVTLFQRVLEDFTHKAREKKFIVRDFRWNEEQMAQEKKALADAGAKEKELWSTLLRLCKTNFGEIFACWVHAKVLRLYVESILRYGLPPDFQPMVLKVKPRQSERKLRDVLNSHFAKLGGAANGPKGGAADEGLEENIQNLLGDKDYCPAVLFSIPVFWAPQ
ncbi:ATPase, V1 complex, subunit C [Zopfochytrium polystomum]|nr:ATPase, V1 complex, subunit C [Zopfochytrium polystomum]